MNNRLNGDDEIDYTKSKTINLEFSMDSLHVASGIMYGNIYIFISYKQTYTTQPFSGASNCVVPQRSEPNGPIISWYLDVKRVARTRETMCRDWETTIEPKMQLNMSHRHINQMLSWEHKTCRSRSCTNNKIHFACPAAFFFSISASHFVTLTVFVSRVSLHILCIVCLLLPPNNAIANITRHQKERGKRKTLFCRQFITSQSTPSQRDMRLLRRASCVLCGMVNIFNFCILREYSTRDKPNRPKRYIYTLFTLTHASLMSSAKWALGERVARVCVCVCA